MNIYLYEGEPLHGEAAYTLIRRAAAMYIDDVGLDLGADFSEGVFVPEIKIAEKGKPYFADVPLEFSVTNSGNMWMCAVSEEPCGIDLQMTKEASYVKLAKRFYKPNEIEYVKRFGKDGFFKLWVRREAYGKAIGEGFFGDIPELVLSMNTDTDADDVKTITLLESIGEYRFTDIEIGEDIYCAACTKDIGPYPIILL